MSNLTIRVFTSRAYRCAIALTVAVGLLLSAVAPAHASTRHGRWRRVTFTHILATVPGDVIHASKLTGYGRMRLTHWQICGKQRCPRHPHRLLMKHRVTNHNPLTATARPDTSGFCWPWDFRIWSGRGCWNEPATWDWPQIWQNWYPGPVIFHGVPGMDTRLMQECREGMLDGGTFGVAAGKSADILLGLGAKLTPQTYASFALGGCLINVYHHIPGTPV